MPRSVIRLLLCLVFAANAFAATFTVNSSADTDDGVCDATNCTLREAINAANASGGGTIAFAIGSGPVSITLAGGLNDIMSPTVIDGTTQPGYAGSPLVQITGQAGTNTLVIRSSDTTVRALDIGNCGDAIAVIAASVAITNIAFERNFIGTRLASAPIHGRGISFATSGTGTISGVRIGNATPEGRNLLATYGFVQDSVYIGGNTSNVTIAGNYFGLADDGTPLLTEARYISDLTIAASPGSSNIVVGGSTPGARNVFGSGGGTQINIEIDSRHKNLLIEGNYIGTDPTGTIGRRATNFAIWFAGEGEAIIRNNVLTAATTALVRGATTTGPVVVQGNWFNYKADGSGPLLVPADAIMDFSSAPGFTIGGPNAGDGNVIVNYTTGIEVESPGALVQGNLVGLDPTGGTIVGSGSRGIAAGFQTREPGVSIRDNRVAGNTTGIDIGNGALATVDGNYVGTDATGTMARPNGNGIVISGNAGRAIVTNNLISGNTSHGVVLQTATMPVTLTGNRIGLSASGSPLANGGDGIRVTSGTALKRIGTGAASPNTIAWNLGNGINIAGGTATAIRGNSIFANGGLAIDLGASGPDANDAGDTDTGANNLQNAPVLTAATTAGAQTLITGTLNSTPNTSFTIELYTNSSADPSGFGEAETLLTSFVVMTDATGNAAISTTVAPLAPGTAVSAAATNGTTNDTSEMSNTVIASSGVVQFSAGSATVSESGTSVTLTVTRTGGAGSTTAVEFASTNGTATSGSDFGAVSGTLTFGPSDTSKTITIPITSDTFDELDETFTVSLSNVVAGQLGSPATATVTITDDDAPPTISVSDAAVVEGNAGTTTLTFNVSLSAASSREITVDYTTADATAMSGSDYGTRFGTLTFAPGTTSRPVAITINGDVAAEADETLQLLLSTAVDATLADATGIGTITNDDGDPSITVSDVAVIEGASGSSNATLLLTLSNPSGFTVTADWSTNGNTATAGADFSASSGTVTFAPGVVSQSISIPVLGDTTVEGNETFFVDFNNPSNASLADSQATVTIVDDDGSPALTISDVAVNESAGTATATVLLAPASAQTVTVDFNTVAGSAAAVSDFTPASGTLTFTPGQTTRTIDVPVTNDGIDESAEELTLVLSAPMNATTADGEATVTIVDDDETPTISVADTGAIEGSPITFDVTLSNPSANDISVNYLTSHGTAGAADYTSAGGTLSFAPGELTKSVVVATSSDLLHESDETFFFNLNGAANATITRPQATATITDDDGTPAIVIGDATVTEGDSGTVMAAFVVSIAGDASQTITVDYAAANGTASASSDYAATEGHLIFSPGVTTQTIEVPVIGDAIVEPDETFFVNLSNATNATISDNQALGTIVDDDVAATVPDITIRDASAAEGNGGATSLTFIVTLSSATTNTVTVHYATVDGTAVAGTDYAAVSGTLVFAPGVVSQPIVVPVIGDALVEGNETLTVNLDGAANATLADAQAIGTILDDDTAAVVPQISIADATVTEGDGGVRSAQFRVTLDTPSSATVRVDYATANGTATAGDDYAATAGALTFVPGTTSQTIAVAVIGDTVVERDETFTVRLANVVNAVLRVTTGRGTIRNDDFVPNPTVTIDDTSAMEGDGTVRFGLRLSTPSTEPVVVTFHTADRTANAVSDYAESSGTITFAPGETSQSIDVSLVDDGVVEGDETFEILLSTGARATAVIHDDDGGIAAVLVIGGSGAGNHGSFFRTVLQMHNASDEPSSGNLIVRPIGGGEARTFGYALDPRETRDFGSLIDVGGFVTVDLVALSGALPRTSVRVFNDAGVEGRSGFTSTLIPVSHAITAGARGILIAPDDAQSTRFNIGMRALGEGATLHFTLRRAGGAVAAEVTREIGANVLTQTEAGALVGQPIESNNTIEVRVIRGSAIVYGSSVDNTTQDPSFTIAEPMSY